MIIADLMVFSRTGSKVRVAGVVASWNNWLGVSILETIGGILRYALHDRKSSYNVVEAAEHTAIAEIQLHEI